MQRYVLPLLLQIVLIVSGIDGIFVYRQKHYDKFIEGEDVNCVDSAGSSLPTLDDNCKCEAKSKSFVFKNGVNCQKDNEIDSNASNQWLGNKFIQINSITGNWKGLLFKINYRCHDAHLTNCMIVKFTGPRNYPLADDIFQFDTRTTVTSTTTTKLTIATTITTTTLTFAKNTKTEATTTTMTPSTTPTIVSMMMTTMTTMTTSKETSKQIQESKQTTAQFEQNRVAEKKQTNVGMVTGIVIVAIILVILFAVAMVLIICRKKIKERQRNSKLEKDFQLNHCDTTIDLENKEIYHNYAEVEPESNDESAPNYYSETYAGKRQNPLSKLKTSHSPWQTALQNDIYYNLPPNDQMDSCLDCKDNYYSIAVNHENENTKPSENLDELYAAVNK